MGLRGTGTFRRLPKELRKAEAQVRASQLFLLFRDRIRLPFCRGCLAMPIRMESPDDNL
jgi:hypothetical protein